MTTLNVFNIIASLDEDTDSEWTSSDSEEFEIFSTSETSSNCSDSPKPPRRKLRRITTFMDTVREYDEQEFKEHFRLNRSTCEILINMIQAEHVLPEHKFGRKKISAEKAFLMCLWYLSHTDTFGQCADRFNVTKSSCHRTVTKIIEFLVKTSFQYIKWPCGDRLNTIKAEFFKLHGIDGVIGAIDSNHVNIKRPMSTNYQMYYNRKGDYSVLIQGVCDYQKRFISFFCGEPGSIHESRLLKKSSLYRRCTDGLLGNNFLLGDSAYPCLNWLIPPFKDNGNLTQNSRLFNYRHSATRIVIEHAFRLLKGRFRRLEFFENNDLQFVAKCVTAAAVLHNICLNNEDSFEYVQDETSDDDNNLIDVVGASGVKEQHRKRDEIFSKMFG